MRLGILICILLLITATAIATKAEDVKRYIPYENIYPNEEFYIVLTGSINTTITEKIPQDFTFEKVAYTDGADINWMLVDNTLRINVSNLTKPEFTFIYYVKAPSKVGEYEFQGTYIKDNNTYSIGGNKTVYVAPPLIKYGVDIYAESPTKDVSFKLYSVTKFYWDTNRSSFVAEYKEVEGFKVDFWFRTKGTYQIYFKNLESDEIAYKYSVDNNTMISLNLTIPSDLSPGTYYIVVERNATELLNTRTGVLVENRLASLFVRVYTPAKISLSIKNPTGARVAYGDKAIFNVELENIPLRTPATITLSGPMPKTLYYTDTGTWTANPTSYTIRSSEFVIIVRTIDIFERFGGTYGHYTLRVSVQGKYEEMDFEIVEPSVNLTVSSEPRLEGKFRVGQNLIISAKTNVAPSGSEFDDDTVNTVFVRVVAIKYLINSEGKIDENADVTKPITQVYTAYLTIKDDLTTDELKIPLSVNLPVGLYKIEAGVLVAHDILKTKTYYFNFERPLVQIEIPDNLTADTQYDLVMKTTLHSQVPVIIKLLGKNLDDIFETNRSEVTVYTDSEGEIHWVTKVKKDAFGEYELIVTIKGTNYTFSKKIFIERPKLSVAIDKRTLIRGDKLTLTITTNYNRILIFADDYNTLYAIWKNKRVGVGELPSKERSFKLSSLDETQKPIEIDFGTNKENKISVDLYVNPKAEDGYHTIYVIAPLRNDTVDPRTDPLATVVFKVCHVSFIEYPEEVILPRGRAKTVKLMYNTYADFIQVKAWISVSNKKIYIENESGYENGFYYLNLKLKPFVDLENDSLKNNGPPNELLPLGTYKITIKLYNPYSHATESKLEIPLKVVAPKIELIVPSKVELGKAVQIKVISENTDFYDHIYLVIKYGLDVTVTKMKVVNGTATFNWTPEWLGTYKIYVRDTMGTVKGDIMDFYDIPPRSGYAKEYYAQDDILIEKSVEVVKYIPPPTPTPTPTPVNVTPTPTPAVNETNVTMPTPTPTLNYTLPTPTPTKETPTEETSGFEVTIAITAIAIALIKKRLSRR